MKAKNLMSTNPQVITPENTLKDAADKMLKHDVGFLPVEEGDCIVGVVTDRDIVTRGIAKEKDINSKVRDLMTKTVTYCFENDSVDKVADLMGELQIRRLIVLNDKKRIVGIISLSDVATRSQNNNLTGKVTGEISED